MSKAGTTPLVRSRAEARREASVLRRTRERIEDQAQAGEDTSARSGVAQRRMAKS